MAKVRFFGTTRLAIKRSSIEVEASNIEELLKKVCREFSELKLKELRNCVIFLNGENILELQLYKTMLKPGDEVIVMSPVAGG